MSREEQIKWLRRLLKSREDPRGDTEIDVALKCAIKALEAESRMSYVQETVNAIMNTCNTDSIKDKAMRNAAKFVQNAIDGSYPDFEELNQEPCDDAIKYFDAIYKVSQTYGMPYSFVKDKVEEAAKALKSLQQEPCDDCISRQEVLDALDKSKYSNAFCEEHHIDWSINLGMAHIVVNELKPVTPQPKMGKWKAFTHRAYHGNDEDGEPIWREVTVYHCNLCNRRTVIKEKYCPNCGCKMQGVEE